MGMGEPSGPRFPQHLKPDPESQGVAENVMSGLISNTPAQSSPQAFTALGTLTLSENESGRILWKSALYPQSLRFTHQEM